MYAIPSFESDELEISKQRDREKAKRARRRSTVCIDRYWLIHYLSTLRTIPKGQYYTRIESVTEDQLFQGLEPLMNRAYYRSIRAWQSGHRWEERNKNRAERQRVRHALKRGEIDTGMLTVTERVGWF